MHKQSLLKLASKAVSVFGDVKFAEGGSMSEVINRYDLHNPLFLSLILETNALSFALFNRNVLPFVIFRKDENKQLLISDVDGELNFSEVSNAIALMLFVKAIENVFGAQVGANNICTTSAIVDSYAHYSGLYAPGTVVSPIERAQVIASEALIVSVNSMLKPMPEKSLEAEDHIDAAEADESFDAKTYTYLLDEKDEPQSSDNDADLDPFALKV